MNIKTDMFFKADDGRKRKAIVMPLKTDLPVSGVSVKYRKENVSLGKCERNGCDEPSTMETLLGHQLCSKHVCEFYLD